MARIGVTVYDTVEIDEVLKRFTLDLIQPPVSIADQRLHAGGTLHRLVRLGVRIEARSLQRLLLTPTARPPEQLPELAENLGRLPWYGASSAEAAGYCFGFLHQLGTIDKVLIGAHSAQQLDELIAAWRSRQSIETWEKLRFPPRLVYPRIW